MRRNFLLTIPLAVGSMKNIKSPQIQSFDAECFPSKNVVKLSDCNWF